MLAGVVILSYSCATTTAPTNSEMAAGNWEVVEFYVNGQTNGSNIFTRFILERDGSFVLEDQNGLVFVGSAGSWAATGTNLTLNASDGTVFDFVIAYISYNKMQVVQTIAGSNSGDLEIRYLLDRNGSNTYYNSGE